MFYYTQISRFWTGDIRIVRAVHGTLFTKVNDAGKMERLRYKIVSNMLKSKLIFKKELAYKFF